MRYLLRNTLLVIIIGFIGAASARAAFGPLDLVRNSSTAVLQDNFESPGIGSAPDNGALAGTWSVNSSNPSNNVKLWDASLSPNLAAEDGSQYVNIQRTVDAAVWLTGTFSSPITTGTMDARVKAYLPSGTNGGGVIHFDQTSNENTISLLINNASSFVQRYNGSAYVNTTVPYTQNIWQDWLINADLSTQTYTLTVDGASQSGLPFNLANGGNGTFNHVLFIANGTPSQIFIDQVPEPAGVTLAAAGLLLLKRRRTPLSR